MTMNKTVAKSLADGRRSGHKMKAYPGDAPETKGQALELQQAVNIELGWQPIGWKIACTSRRAQEALKTEGPFPGRLFAERQFSSGQKVPTEADNFRVTEPEIVFRMGRSLPPRGRPYDTDEALAAVDAVHPGLEIVNPRLPKGFDDVVEWYIADGALNDAIVIGPPSRPLPRQDYARIQAIAQRNGMVVGTGAGANALAGPEIVLTWLANDLSARGLPLEAGSIVTTGVITEMFSANAGDEITATFAGIGEVSARF
ncbi:MAG TPA: fumarylacetoacetate hydrolase family protein [Aestuariivirgaceae bacterium]|nr:fumarylacetoacetate hydrolase family protein [Aestuariivirgaceae bacterium]